MMDIVDVKALKGQRVFIETQADRAYIGTLKAINERSFCITDWILVEEWDEGHVVSYTNGETINDHWAGDLYLAHSGLLQEVLTIQKNLKIGDPYVKS